MRRLMEKDSLLTGINLRHCALLLFALLALSCQHQGNDKLSSGESFGNIIYEANIVNRDSSDVWATECLSKFDRKALINSIFENVFNGKITPYDYFTGEKISPDKIRDMEKEGIFSRENINKVRFEERWVWNNEKVEIQKQIISLTIAYEVFDHNGESRGQKPIFKVIFIRK